MPIRLLNPVVEVNSSHQKFSRRRCAKFCLFFCFICTIVYIPLFYTITFQQGPSSESPLDHNFTWTINSTRDVATYVQPENLTAIIPNEGLCNGDDSPHPFLLVMICSAVDNFEARQAIRKSWMSLDYLNWTSSVPIKMAFLLGQPVNDTRQADVLAESHEHGDIIQEGFVDAYLNLTLKTVMLLKWVRTRCPQVTFVLKTDDDMFVNVPALVHFLTRPEVRQRKDLIVGSLFCRVQPIKDFSSKWYSPKFMFNEREYPDYVSGTGYVISGRLVPALFDTALKVPLFHLEDVFTTGMVARKAGIVPENFHLFSYLKHPVDNACLYRKIITSHGLSTLEMDSIWRKINDPLLNCTAVQLPKIGEPRVKKCRKPGKQQRPLGPPGRRIGRAG